MGYQVGWGCFETAREAADVYYSGVSPVLHADGFSQYQIGSEGWQLNTYQNGANGPVLVSSIAAPTVFPECSNLQRFLDGAELGWGIAGAVLAAYAIKFLWESRI